jgi:hypothetical protein
VFGPSGLAFLAASCILGVGISYTGWRTRSIITATTFTLVGVLNKIATIIFTVVFWPTESSSVSIVALVCCILLGLLYQEAPKRKEYNNNIAAVKSCDQRKELALVCTTWKTQLFVKKVPVIITTFRLSEITFRLEIV